MDRAATWRPRCSGLGEWLSAGYVHDALTPPAMTRVPVYSTWYSFTQDIDTDVMLAESRLATDLGCSAVFIDDGWQNFGHGRGYQGCGDWVPDEVKFADLPTTVKQIQGMGAAVGLWIAPLLLGRESQAIGELDVFAPQWDSLLSCQVLDPRHPEVRSHVEETCLRLVIDYGVDLLKIDFLDRAMIYQDSDELRRSGRHRAGHGPDAAGCAPPARRGRSGRRRVRVPPAVREPGDRLVRGSPAGRRLSRRQCGEPDLHAECPDAVGRAGGPCRSDDVGDHRRGRSGGPAALRRLVRRPADLDAAGRPAAGAVRKRCAGCSRCGAAMPR